MDRTDTKELTRRPGLSPETADGTAGPADDGESCSGGPKTPFKRSVSLSWSLEYARRFGVG